jgi:uncharacterized protein YdaU (DUF1376 family)
MRVLRQGNGVGGSDDGVRGQREPVGMRPMRGDAGADRMGTPMIPYFPFYPSDWLSSPRVTTSDYEDRGLYIHLLCQTWGHPGCQLPDNQVYLMRLCPGARWKRISRVLETFFTKVQLNTDFWWRNDRLTVEFHKALEKHSKAKVSANHRWNKENGDAVAMRTDMPTQCERNANQNQNQKNHIRKPSKPANPSIRVLQEYLKSAFEKKYGSAPVMSYPAIGKQLKVLLEKEKFTEGALKDAIDWFLTSPKAGDHPTPAAAISTDTIQRWQVACPEVE